MKVNILLFGITKDIIGGDNHTVELQEPATVLSLKEKLLTDYPKLTKLRSMLVAVNDEYGQDDQIVKTSDEIALIPPVSGG